MPRVVASLFLSPFGEKFIHFVLALSRYVLLQVIRKENGMPHQIVSLCTKLRAALLLAFKIMAIFCFTGRRKKSRVPLLSRKDTTDGRPGGANG